MLTNQSMKINSYETIQGEISEHLEQKTLKSPGMKMTQKMEQNWWPPHLKSIDGPSNAYRIPGKMIPSWKYTDSTQTSLKGRLGKDRSSQATLKEPVLMSLVEYTKARGQTKRNRHWSTTEHNTGKWRACSGQDQPMAEVQTVVV